MSISSIGAVPAFRVAGAAQSPIPPVQPVQAPAPLAPAVRVDIQSGEQRGDPRAGTGRSPEPSDEAGSKAGPSATEPRIRIDQDTKVVVYQEVDPNSGDVVIQLPDPVVLKARAYAEAAEARAHPTARPLDRTA